MLPAYRGSSGFKLHVANLKSLSLTLGPNTTAPLVSLGISVDYQPFVTVNVSEGVNEIDVTGANPSSSVVRFNVEEWQDNRMNLETIELNPDAELLPYVPQPLAFQFIGDSLSAGQFLPMGVDQAWNFMTAETFKAEHRINAQPGAALTDMESYGNVHGVSFQYFRTEDTGYYNTPQHNYTTPWDFLRDQPPPTHFVIHIGANDASWDVPEANFTQTYLAFVERIRTMYPVEPIFVFTPWGWPQPDGPNSYYYPNAYADVVAARHALGDEQVFLVNTTGWVDYSNVYPGNIHPNVEGHQKIAGLFQTWLRDWGLQSVPEWLTPA
ncbi:SGNH hydrolase-type esterase domain-containing protein [Fomitopsis serialis]|uniref:SGNH hydrolase-type esterase domain-containing protein n=1 Tax=Fomitopsis serialis TaxID=139415 RepID=UPI0020088F87|nr:SGNH hydrolase-type esterase domain-containing protein [Neoantrodia serialis]KAH9919117.1 SGNH hydrolase-type esterase domain-containing protein [Neoantrodia serialis]